ncbi:MAG: hypothetical protein OIN86_07975 [Candidatus Methanoperedens sp.]|nr:hypothetical protein [Candidatus Methanoperedens sp.]
MAVAILAWWLNEQSEGRRIEREEKSRQKENEKEKMQLCKIIISEVKINQSRIKPLYDSANKILFMSWYDWANVGLQQHNRDEKYRLPNRLKFDKDIYSSLSDKLGTLDDDCRNKLVNYYSEFEYIEEEYKRLDINGGSYLYLVYPLLRDYDKSISKSKWDEIDSFLIKTKKEYNLGEELVNDLNAFACILNQR